jgi:hypothetical protein
VACLSRASERRRAYDRVYAALLERSGQTMRQLQDGLPGVAVSNALSRLELVGSARRLATVRDLGTGCFRTRWAAVADCPPPRPFPAHKTRATRKRPNPTEPTEDLARIAAFNQ